MIRAKLIADGINSIFINIFNSVFCPSLITFYITKGYRIAEFATFFPCVTIQRVWIIH